LRLTDTTPTSGEDVYLYCHEVHRLTESSSTLSPDLEKVLIDGVVAMTAMAFLNKMRDQIVPSSIRLYEAWAAFKEADYKAGLREIAKSNVWQF
jgi:DNA-binding ferritin-like protein (Dps family)